jgi:hypothetical protein
MRRSASTWTVPMKPVPMTAAPMLAIPGSVSVRSSGWGSI